MKKVVNAIGLVFFLLMISCQMFQKSENLLLKEFYNSRESIKIIVFEKVGNATTNNSIHASVRGYDYELTNDDIGNIFIADQFESTNFVRDSFLLVTWLSDEVVEITYPSSVRLFKIEEIFDDNIRSVKIKHNSRKEI